MAETDIIDQAISDVIKILDTDPVLARLPSYSSQFEVDANTVKPCKSVDFEVEKDATDSGNTGGCIEEYTSTGFIIIYLPPDYRKEEIRPKLDEFRVRNRNALKTAVRNDTFQVLTSWRYIESKPRPWLVQHNNGPRLLAHRMITDFEASYMESTQ